MKKVFLAILLVFVAFFFTGAAMASDPVAKVPKSMCLNVPATDVVFSIATKAGGSMKISGNQKIKFYDIQGNYFDGVTSTPIDGSGYMNGNIFHFSFRGLLYTAPDALSISGDAYFNISAQTGSINILLRTDAGVGERIWTVEAVPCSSVTIPYSEPQVP